MVTFWKSYVKIKETRMDKRGQILFIFSMQGLWKNGHNLKKGDIDFCLHIFLKKKIVGQLFVHFWLNMSK